MCARARTSARALVNIGLDRCQALVIKSAELPVAFSQISFVCARVCVCVCAERDRTVVGMSKLSVFRCRCCSAVDARCLWWVGWVAWSGNLNVQYDDYVFGNGGGFGFCVFDSVSVCAD